MNSPIIKTLLMAVAALITSSTAAWFYPWPEPVVQSEIVGEPIFESYAAGAVRSIRIEKFNIDLNRLELIQLEQIGGKWVIPSRENFVATNSFQIKLATQSLDEKTILEERTDQQQDHLKYGVVDPTDFGTTTNRSGLGTKIILEGRNRKQLASLIVGRGVGAGGTQGTNASGAVKHFVRIPGQSSVYVIEFHPGALNTRFRNWIDSNLFQFSNDIPLNRMKVEDYRMDATTLAPDSRKDRYRAVLAADVTPQIEIHVDNTWKPVEVTLEINQRIQGLVRQLSMLAVSGVVRKETGMAELFKSPKTTVSDEDFDSLKPYGFLITGFGNSIYNFDSAGGEMIVEFGDGVSVALYIGSEAEKSASDDLKTGRYVLMCAGVNEAIFPVPPKPLKAEDPAVAEEANKDYLRKVEARKAGIRSARQRAAALNQSFGDWIYVVPDSIVQVIRPDLGLNSASPSSLSTSQPKVGASPESGGDDSGNSKKIDENEVLVPPSKKPMLDPKNSVKDEAKPEAAATLKDKAAEGESRPIKPKPKSPKNDPFGG